MPFLGNGLLKADQSITLRLSSARWNNISNQLCVTSYVYFVSTFMPERRNYNHTTSLLFISLFNYYANLVANQLNNYQFYLILKTLSNFLKSSPEKRIKNKYTFAFVNVRAVIVCICDLFFWDFNFNSVNLIFCCLPYKRKMAIFDYSRF